MTIRMFSKKSEGKVLWGILLEDDDNQMEYHPGGLEKTIEAYEELTGQRVTEGELMGLQIN